MTLDPAITGFDIIYISWGGVCWAPNINDWARLVAGRLNPGGLLVVSEHHPLWEVLAATSGALAGSSVQRWKAGLTIRSLQEFPEGAMYPGLGAPAANLPATYLLTAVR